MIRCYFCAMHVRLRSIPIAILALLLIVALRLPLPAQQPTNSPRKGNIRLELLRTDLAAEHEGRSEQVIIRVWNESDKALSLPEPNLTCNDLHRGTMKLYAKELRSGNGPKARVACLVDYFFTDILTRAKDWITIAPGAYYDVQVALLSAAIYPGGKYEVRAEYRAPSVSATEVRMLEEHGIFVAAQITSVSNSIIVERPDALPGLPLGILW